MKRPFSSRIAAFRRFPEDVFGATDFVDGEDDADVANSSLPVENDPNLEEAADSRPFRFFPFIFCFIQLERDELFRSTSFNVDEIEF